MSIRIVRYINKLRAWLVNILCMDLGVAMSDTAQNLILSVPKILLLLLVRHVVVYVAVGSC